MSGVSHNLGLSFPCVAKVVQLALFVCILIGIMLWFMCLSDMDMPCANTSKWLREHHHLEKNPDTNYNVSDTIVITLQCNEYDILGLWIEYHAEIFGINNIIILDNYSTRPDVIDLLKDWEARGLRVLWEQGPYLEKGDLVLEAATKYSSLGDSQVLIPVDIDEFLAVFDTSANGGMPIVNKYLVHQEIKKFQESAFAAIGLRPYYESMAVYANDTVHTVGTFYKNAYTEKHAKKMVRLNTVKRIDHGAHKVIFKEDGGNYIRSSTMILGYLHYHHRGPERTLQRALIDCASLNLIPTDSTLESIKQGDIRTLIIEGIKGHVPGHHKLSELLAYIDGGLTAPLLLHPLGFDEKDKVTLPPLSVLIRMLAGQNRSVHVVSETVQQPMHPPPHYPQRLALRSNKTELK